MLKMLTVIMSLISCLILANCSSDLGVSPDTTTKQADLGSIPYNWEVDNFKISGIGSKTGPVGCNYNGRLYVFCRGNSTTSLYYKYSDNEGSNWSAQYKIPVNVRSSHSPAVVVFNNKIWVLYKGENGNSIFYMTMDASGNWSSQGQLLDCKTNVAPSATSDDNYLYLAFKGYQTYKMYVKRISKSGELTLVALKNSEPETNATPAIGIMPDGMPAIVYNKNGTSGGINKACLMLLKCSGQSTTQMTWLDPKVVCNTAARTNTDWAGAVCSNNGIFTVFWKGEHDNRIYYSGCDANQVWTLQYNIPSARTGAVPGVCTVNSKVVILFKGQSSPDLYISKGKPIH